MSNKTLLGGLAGGLATFLLGWLIYGILLNDFMAANYNNCASRPMENYIWWAMILSNLFSGFSLAFVFQWGSISGMKNGFMKGGILGFFIAASMDLSFYAMSTMFLNGRGMAVDIVVSTVFYAVVGGIVGWVMGMGGDKKEA